MLKKYTITSISILLVAVSPLLFGFDLGKELGNILQQTVDHNLKPEVKFEKFTYIGKSQKGVEGLLVFKIKNRLDSDSKNIKYNYKLFLNNNTVEGGSDNSFQLKGNEEKTISIPLMLTYNHMFATPVDLVTYLYSQEGQVKFTGTIKFKYDFGVTSAESDHKINGSFPLDFLDLRLQSYEQDVYERRR